jgi:cytochrome c oxidase cbb3-type subunit 3
MKKRLSSIFLSASMTAVFGLLVPMASAQAADPNPNAVRNYNTYCTQCHGVERNGKGVNSKYMSVQPRDHSDAKGMVDIPDNELFKAIKEGGLSVNKSVLMPAWGDVLSDAEVNELVAYLRHVCNCGSK